MLNAGQSIFYAIDFFLAGFVSNITLDVFSKEGLLFVRDVHSLSLGLL
jgi:hypothetical protein